MELPFHLKTLQPLKGALDILRYFGSIEAETADADEICDALDLSDRSFSKAIRRLVTKGYVAMDGDLIYRLTDQGFDAVEDLAVYDDATGGGLFVHPSDRPASPAPMQMTRRLVVALPHQFVVGQAAEVMVGFNPAQMPGEAEMVVRVSVVNGEPETPADTLFNLTSAATYQRVAITPGRYDKIRLRFHAVQLGPNPGDFHNAGGMYVDVPVVAQANDEEQLAAYGADVNVQL